MRSIMRVWAWVHPVLIGRDEERRPPVQLRLVPSPGCSLPALRSRQHLLLAELQRSVAPAIPAPCRTALSEQPPGPSPTCRAPAALSRTPPAPAAGEAGSGAESDASPFDRRAAAFCCGADAGRASGNTTLRARAARPGLPMRSLWPVLRAGGLSGAAPGTKGMRWPSTSRPAPRSCACITPRSGRSARSHASSASITSRSTAFWPTPGCPGKTGGAGARSSTPSCPSSARRWQSIPG